MQLLPSFERFLCLGCVGCGHFTVGSYDALSAKLIEQAEFDFGFMSGFGVAASKGYPDTGLLSYAEMLEQGRSICEITSIPMIGMSVLLTSDSSILSVLRCDAEVVHAGVDRRWRHGIW